MIIAFAIIALIIISWLSIGIYSIFIPFMQNISDIQSYNNAYYGAMSATERALLITKQQQFWFNGSWWRKWQTQRWPTSDYSDPSMGIITENNNWIQRNIKGRTTRIPQEGKGNIPKIFWAEDSSNFNKFSPQDTIRIATQVNNNNDPESFYTTNIDKEHLAREYINTQRRIPPYIQDQQDETTANLCDEYNPICNAEGEADNNTIILRQRRGIVWGSEFLIIPTTQIFKTGTVIYIRDDDMHIRESIINTNNSPKVDFADMFNPITNNSSTVTEHTTLWPWWDDIKTIVFKDIFDTPNIEELYLEYTMVQSPISKAWFIYPFLEYAIVSDVEMSDTHRYIESQSTVGNYEVKIQIDKPQNENVQWSNFTIVF